MHFERAVKINYVFDRLKTTLTKNRRAKAFRAFLMFYFLTDENVSPDKKLSTNQGFLIDKNISLSGLKNLG